MKQIFTLLLIFVAHQVFSQNSCLFTGGLYNRDFDTYNSNSPCDSFWIDTTLHDNIWQIGRPHKPVFDTTSDSTNVIITDTVNPYPINNISAFYWRINLGNVYPSVYSFLSGYYFIKTDSLKDYGEIYFSRLVNGGTNWINISGFQLGTSQPPNLTGSSKGWQSFQIDFDALEQLYNFQFGDTLLLRFTFKSDTTFDNKGGLMYDDFYFANEIGEGVHAADFNKDGLQIFPVPSADIIHVRLKQYITSVTYHYYITDLTGKVLEEQELNKGFADFNIASLSSGMYIMNITGSRGNLYHSKFLKL